MKHSFSFTFQLPSVLVIHFLLQIKQNFLQLYIIRMSNCFFYRSLILTQQNHQRRITFKDLFQNSCLRFKRRVLRQVFHYHSSGNGQLTTTSITIGNHLQKSTLASTVDTNDTYFVPFFYVKVYIFKQNSVPITKGQIFSI